jgi:integrase
MAIWRFAHKLGRAAAVDAPEVLTEPKREPIAFMDAQMDQLIAYARRLPKQFGLVPVSVWWECFYQVEYCSGERISALMLTPTSGLDLAAGTLVVPADIRKDSEDGRYDLLPGCVDVLRKLAPHGQTLRLFGDWPYDRANQEWDTLRAHYRKHQVEAGLYASLADIPPRVSGFHRLRRTTASYLAKERGIAYAQSYLGHSTSKVTERYLDPRIVGHLKVRGVLREIGGRQLQQLRLFDEKIG